MPAVVPESVANLSAYDVVHAYDGLTGHCLQAAALRYVCLRRDHD